jgi:predicted membrane protein
MRRLDDFEDRKKYGCNNKQDKRLGVGVVFIFIGALFIFSNIGLIPHMMRHYIFSWQMILIVIGLFTLAGNKNRTVGLILISVGVFFILPGLFGMERIGLGKLWPLVFVGVGAYILVRRNREQKDFDFPEMETKTNNEDFLDDLNVFGGSKRNITSKNFIGGRTTAIFGGSDYDFTNADLAKDVAVLDVIAIFGGNKVVVPSDWDVTIDVVSIFGGFSDKRRTLKSLQVNTNKRLIIKGLALFGGGEVRNM